jgi:hypothetical protein
MRNKDLVYGSNAAFPFIIIQIACLLLYTYWPAAVLWLPRAAGTWTRAASGRPLLSIKQKDRGTPRPSLRRAFLM